MGQLTRKVSVRNICVHGAAGAPSPCGAAEEGLLAGGPRDSEVDEDDGKSPRGDGHWEVNCGCCTVSLRTGSPATPGLGRLEIRLTAGAGTGFQSSRSALDRLAAVLRRVLDARMDFVMMLDFQKRHPAPDFARALGRFFDEHQGTWAGRLKSAALLIKENIFPAVAQALSGFVEVCPLGCPFVVCHGEEAAEEFFQASYATAEGKQRNVTPHQRGEDEDGAPFVSVVDVLDAPQHPGVFRSPSWTGRSSCCLASLAPLQSRFGNMDACSQAHTFHMLPNGDVRVIQSPPQGVVLRAEAEQRERGGRLSHKVAPPKQLKSAIFSGVDLATIGGLRFECSKERMELLIGAHFHIGEIVVDAEAFDSSRAKAPGSGADCCCDGITMMLRKLFRQGWRNAAAGP